MNFFIRKAYVRDAEAICFINASSLGYKYPLSDTVKKLQALGESKTDVIFVAQTSRGVVGYIHAAEYETLYTPSVVNILGLAVRDDFQNKGVGSALVKAVEVWARENGKCGVRLASASTRINAHRFYENRGYICDKAQLRFIKYFEGIVN